ncbi:HNH endonuclease [Polynucleobacter paneuropaeus]|nr:HNH endonuclease [Polynucleobacter paneuropaeus]
MRRRYSPPKFSISKATMPTLLKKKVEVTGQIHALESELTLPLLTQEARSLEAAESRIREIYKKIAELRKSTQVKKGLMGNIFGSTEITPEAQRQISTLNIEQESLMAKISGSHWKAVKSQSSKASYRDAKLAFLEKIDARIALLERKKDNLESLKNRAAKTSDEVRLIASSVKKKLDKNDECPYCGEWISDVGHADHIYPVSKGGRSLKKNMVYVCAQCNLKKKDMTLTMFIKKFDLDRDSIEDRLQALGKEF